MADFKDPETGEVVRQETQHSYSITSKVYKDRFGKELRNANGKPLELVIEEKDWSDPDSVPSFLAFGSKSNEEKKKILTKRSRDRGIQDNRELKDKKDWIDGKGRPKPKVKQTFNVTETKSINKPKKKE